MKKAEETRRSRRYPVRVLVARILGLALIAGAAVALVFAANRYHNTPGTDDAVIAATVVPVSASVPGRVVEVAVADNSLVAQGDLLFRVDPEPYALRLEQARAMLRTAEAELSSGQRMLVTERANADIARQQIQRAESNLELTRQTLTRLENLLPQGYVTAQAVDDARTAHNDAQVSLYQAQSQVLAAESMIGTLEARQAQVDLARVSVELAERELRETEVRAPIAGRITSLDLGSGTYVATAVPLFSLIDTDWKVQALFRETELLGIPLGAPVDIFVSADPNRRLQGTVESIGFGIRSTGDISVLGLPIVQSSLDWVRVAQRFPVTVRIQSPPEELMRIGASASVIIRQPDD